MSVEGLLGTDAVFAADLHELRPQPGQAGAAANLRSLLADSAIVASHRGPEDTRVQDAYSLRCAPVVTAPRATRSTTPRRWRSASWRRPSTTRWSRHDGRVESNGNFHGAPLAYVLDFLAIVAADLASISERRTDRFLDVARSHGLPPFLAADPGVDSGLHARPVHAGGARRPSSSGWRRPASVDSIPTSAMQEDHVSMGWTAGLKLRRAVAASARCWRSSCWRAARAIHLRAPLDAGPGDRRGRDRACAS